MLMTLSLCSQCSPRHMAVASCLSPEACIQALPTGSGSHMQSARGEVEEYSCSGYRHGAGSTIGNMPGPLQEPVGARADSSLFPGQGSRGVGRSGHIPTRQHNEVCSQCSYRLPAPELQPSSVGQTAITNMLTCAESLGQTV